MPLGARGRPPPPWLAADKCIICRWSTFHVKLHSNIFQILSFSAGCETTKWKMLFSHTAGRMGFSVCVWAASFRSHDLLYLLLFWLFYIECVDVTAAMLVSLNKGTAAMLVSPTNPPGIELYYHANLFFCFGGKTSLPIT